MNCISLLHRGAGPAPLPPSSSSSSSLSSSQTFLPGSRLARLRRRTGFLPPSPIRLSLRVSCTLQEEEEEERGGEQEAKTRKIIRVPAIRTILQVASAAASIAALAVTLPVGRRDEPIYGKGPSEATTSDGAGKKSRGAKKANVMPLEERLEWTKGLPVVQEKIAYTDLLSLRMEGKLKHIIKYPVSKLKSNPNIVLVVLDDDRVVRTVLPSPERDQRFWSAWDDLKLESSVVNAFTPPLPNPKLEGWGWANPFFSGSQLSGTQEAKKRQQLKQSTTKKEYTSAARGRLEQLEKARKDIERARLAKEAQLRRQQMLKANAERERKAKVLSLQEQEEKRKRESEAKQAKKEKLIQQVQASTAWDDFLYTASRNEGFRFVLGLGFFWLFYQTVILGVKKRKKDYEDRLKIEKAEDEERRKLKEWEDEMDTAQAVQTAKDWDREGMSEDERRRLEEAEMNPQVQMGLRFMRSGARVRRATGRRPPKYLDLEADVKFTDVAGLGEIRKELEEIVDFFTYKEKFQRKGSKIPAGILLCGEPGTGKTLLAKAVAGEAGVNFFSISASQFVEIYVGVGASRVRALYQEARENAPAVVFIDELDAVGRQRGLIGGSGGQERDATLNQLLTCLDGFEGKGDVITIAATNRADILDAALVRPGRFDRKIYIPKPGAIGRTEILKVHARNKPMAEDVDYDAVADVTDGMVGAQLANLLDVAALNVLRDGRIEITTDDLLEAAQLEEGGHPDTRPRSKELWHRVALNEASMAVAAINFADFNNIQLLTITPRVGEEKGGVRIHMDHSKFELSSVSRQGMMDYITLHLAPRAADEIWYGRDQMSTIWADSFNHARKAARNFVFVGLSGRKDLYGLLSCWCELDRVYEIDVEALKILDTCYNRAIQILERNRKLVDELVDHLINQKVMRKEQFWQLVEQHGSELEEVPPQAMDVRNAQVKLFQEQMISGKQSHAL